MEWSVENATKRSTWILETMIQWWNKIRKGASQSVEILISYRVFLTLVNLVISCKLNI